MPWPKTAYDQLADKSDEGLHGLHAEYSYRARGSRFSWSTVVEERGRLEDRVVDEHKLVGRRFALSGVLAVAVLLAMPVLGEATGGHSGTCGPVGGAQVGYFSVGCRAGVTQISDEAEFQNAGLYTAYWASGDHINESVWAFSGSPCGDSVEVGLTYGFEGGAYYGWYYADTTGAGQYAHFIGSQYADGSDHIYTIAYDGASGSGGEYSVYIDGADYANIGDIGLGYGTCQGMIGLESSTPPSSNTSANTFNDTPLYWENTSGGWSSSFISTYYVPYPCGLYGNRSGPACFNGAEYSSSYWANNQG